MRKRFKVSFHLNLDPYHLKYFKTLEKALNYAIKRLTATNIEDEDYKKNPFYSTIVIIRDHKSEIEDIILESYFGRPGLVDPRAILKPDTPLKERFTAIGKEEILKVFLKKNNN